MWNLGFYFTRWNLGFYFTGWNLGFYFTGWNFGFYCIWKSQYFQSHVDVIRYIIQQTLYSYPSGAQDFTPGCKWVSCYSIFSFKCMFCISFFYPFVLFLLAILLSVLLRYTDSGYPFDIFKLVFVLLIMLMFWKFKFCEVSLIKFSRLYFNWQTDIIYNVCINTVD